MSFPLPDFLEAVSHLFVTCVLLLFRMSVTMVKAHIGVCLSHIYIMHKHAVCVEYNMICKVAIKF